MKIPSSLDTRQIFFVEFASIAWSTALKSTVFGRLDLPWSSSFLQLERNFLNHLVIVLWSTVLSTFVLQIFFSCFYRVMVLFELVTHKFQNLITLHIHLCSFQIIYRMKQCTTCLRSNYHDTTKPSEYLEQLEPLRNTRIANHHTPKYCWTFYSSL